MIGVLPHLVKAIEFRKISPNGLIKIVGSQEMTLSHEGYHLVRVFSQEKHGAPFKMVRDIFVLPKSTILWHWQGIPPGDSPFFGYSAKWGYKNSKRSLEVPVIHSFIQQLNLNNSTDPQVLARIWHNSCPHKVGTFIWLHPERRAPCWHLAPMHGVPPRVRSALTKSPNHLNTAFSNMPKLNTLGKRILEFDKNGGHRTTLPSLGLFFF
jgi:hypothetical protein